MYTCGREKAFAILHEQQDALARTDSLLPDSKRWSHANREDIIMNIFATCGSRVDGWMCSTAPISINYDYIRIIEVTSTHQQ